MVEWNDRKMTRRDFVTGLGACMASSALPSSLLAGPAESSAVNVLLITVDDMDYGSLGVTGCKIPGITPNIDSFSKQGVRFEHAHNTSAICQPSRSAIMTGRFPHRNGAMGFEPISSGVPTLTNSLKEKGYTNGILAKVEHLQPEKAFAWDFVVQGDKLGYGREPELYYKYSKEFFESTKSSGKPFFLMANSQDPHRPFPSTENREKAHCANIKRWFKPKDVTVPGFLPDGVEPVREEVARYFTAVHRCDETVGQILRALKDSGFEDNTLVVFLSDNGMAFPYAKTNCYSASTRTPLIIRWPGHAKKGSVNNTDMVSGIDIMPTILDAAGVPAPQGLDGRSFLPLLRGGKQAGRDRVFTFISKTVAKVEYPMRCVRNRRYSYIFNAWSDGNKVFRNESQSGLTWAAMVAAAEKDPAVAERVRFFQYRVLEEFYDLEADPCEKHNLIKSAQHLTEIEILRSELEKMMVSSQDPVLSEFRRIVRHKS